MHAIDNYLTSAINAYAGLYAALDIVMISITYFGVPCMVLWTVLQWWSVSNRPFRRHVVVTAGLAFVLGLVINQIVLLLVHRLRPYDAGLTHLLIAPTLDPSFPSDHATASFSICCGFLVKGLKREALFLALASILICLSRVYVGTHYVTDVIGGILTALIAALIVSRLYGFRSRIDLLLTRLL